MSMRRIELAVFEEFSKRAQTRVTTARRDVFEGASGALRAIDREIDVAARFNVKTLLTGENGVGKNVVARLIHARGMRRGPFVPVNCAGIPDSLLEAELFGHETMSTAGTRNDTRGRLEQAAGGTLFLDEVAEMSLRMQALVLQFLEKGEIQRVGSGRTIAVDNVRVIAATNHALFAAVAGGAFREDLYYRLNIIHIVVPPLRDRPEDVAPLAGYFLDRFSVAHNIARPRLSPQAIARLQNYPWPGNVRELRNIVEQMIVCNRTGFISVVDLPPAVSGPMPASRPIADLLYEQMVDAGQPFWAAVYRPFTSDKLTRDDLRALVARGLDQTRGSYKDLLRLFNLPPRDYKRFLNFLKKNECRMPLLRFRVRSFRL
jgi:DNA-binding NtrC family response regulator